MNRIISPNLLRALMPSRVESYIQAHGWKQKTRQQYKFSVWTKNENELMVPLDTTFADYALRMSELVSTLSQEQVRGAAEILKDLSLIDTDVIRVRADSPRYNDGTMPLILGVELINSAHHMISASANAAHKAQAVYRGKAPEQVRTYLSEVRLGQTEIGSFVATFISPLPIDQPTLFHGKAFDPYERSVTKTLLRALSSMCAASSEYAQIGKIEVFKEVISEGVNSNLCEAIIGLSEAAPLRDVDISVSWSALIPCDQIARITVPQSLIPAILEGRDYLKFVDVPEDITLEGYILMLSKEKALKIDEGIITILTNIDGATRHVRVNISEGSHRLAIQAYKEGLRVSCSGRLVKHGRYWHLTTPSPVIILENDLEDTR